MKNDFASNIYDVSADRLVQYAGYPSRIPASGRLTACNGRFRQRRLQRGRKPVVSEPASQAFLKGVSVLYLAQNNIEQPADLLQTFIDALTAHIATLDHDGRIIAVNRGWKQFADDNGGSLPNYGLGLNYIALCTPNPMEVPDDAKALEDFGYSQAVATGLMDVLHGDLERFQLTYPCHAPDVQRWYLLTATPIPIDGRRGLIVAHENVTTLKQREEAITAALVGTVEAIADIAEVRDPYTAGHQRCVARLGEAIANHMGLDVEITQAIRLGAMIHDIGKIAVPAEILSRPGRLSDAEMQLVRTHCQTGYDMVANIPFPWPLAEIILQHHERMDGSGYPGALPGDSIRIEARVVAVADVVDAISSHRPYRPSRGIARANDEIRAGAGTRYDRAVAAAYLSDEVQSLATKLYSPVN
jgi:putative nucleotidyltransferase with HDIG domain